jgi:hypothetical protein
MLSEVTLGPQQLNRKAHPRLPFSELWYLDAAAAVGYALRCSRSHDAVIRVYGDAGNAIETREHNGEF